MFFEKKWDLLASAACTALLPVYASAALTIDPGPGYVLTAGGYRSSTSSIAINPGVSEASAGGTGLMIGSATYYKAAAAGSNGAGTATVSNAFVVTPTGPTILNNAPGSTSAYSVKTINPSGTLITGTTTLTTGDTAATVWTPNGTAYTIPLPANSSSTLVAAADTGISVNDSGTVVGGSTLYSGTTQLGPTGWAYFNTGTSTSPVYAATSVDQLLPVDVSTATSNNQSVLVLGVGKDGTAFGQSSTTHTGTTITGRFATVWSTNNVTPGSASTVAGTPLTVTAPAALPNIYNTAGSGGSSLVNAINANNVAVGGSSFYATASSAAVTEPVRWTLASSTVGTVLSVPASYTEGTVLAVNGNGDGVGDVNATGKQAAVLWKSGTTTPITLSPETSPVVDPGTGATYSLNSANAAGTTAYDVRGVNDGGYSVGFALSTSNQSTPIDALVWDGSGNVTELNSLVNLTTVASGVPGFLTLVGAYSITNDGWISGLGVYYDPADATYNTGNPQPYGAYGAGAYYRTFEIQDTAAVPEPASAVTLLGVSAAGMLRRRRSSRVD